MEGGESEREEKEYEDGIVTLRDGPELIFVASQDDSVRGSVIAPFLSTAPSASRGPRPHQKRHRFHRSFKRASLFIPTRKSQGVTGREAGEQASRVFSVRTKHALVQGRRRKTRLQAEDFRTCLGLG